MPDGAVFDEGQPVQARQPLPSSSLQIAQLILGTLPGNRHFRLGGFAQSQRHDPVLCGTDPGTERTTEIIAANVDEVTAFLQTAGSQLHLIGAFDEVGGGGRVEGPERLGRLSVWRQIEKRVSGHDAETRVPGRWPGEFFPNRHQFAVKGLVLPLARLTPDRYLEEVEPIRYLALFVDEDADLTVYAASPPPET